MKHVLPDAFFSVLDRFDVLRNGLRAPYQPRKNTRRTLKLQRNPENLLSF